MAGIATFFGSLVLKFSGLSTTIKLYFYMAAAAVLMSVWGFSIYKSYSIGSTVGAAAVTARYEKANSVYKKKIDKLETDASATAIASQAKEKELEKLRTDILLKAPKVKIVTKDGRPMTCTSDVEPTHIITSVTEAITGTAEPAEEKQVPVIEDWYLGAEFAKTWNALIVVGE